MAINYLVPKAWLVNDRAFTDLYHAQCYQAKFTHHTIQPLYLG